MVNPEYRAYARLFCVLERLGVVPHGWRSDFLRAKFPSQGILRGSNATINIFGQAMEYEPMVIGKWEETDDT